jgi:hypothetical protein
VRQTLHSVLPTILLALCALPAFSTTLNVVFYDNRFGTIDDVTGNYSQIGTLPVSQSAGIASLNGFLYLEDMGTNLYTVNANTGAAALVGSTGLHTTASAFASDVSGLFEVDYSSNLYSVNAGTGAAQLIGATGLVANNGAFDTSLAGYGNSLFYTAGRAGSSDELYEIDPMTGMATDLGSTGLTGIAGAAVVGTELELFQYGQPVNYIYSAAIGSTNFSRQAQLAVQILDGGAAASPAGTSGSQSTLTPEPTPGLLLVAGLLMLAVQRRLIQDPRTQLSTVSLDSKVKLP